MENKFKVKILSFICDMLYIFFFLYLIIEKIEKKYNKKIKKIKNTFKVNKLYIYIYLNFIFYDKLNIKKIIYFSLIFFDN